MPEPRHRPPATKPENETIHALVSGLAQRARLRALAERRNGTLVLGLFAFVAGVVSIAVMSVAALVTGEPLVFPSLGPTAFLLFSTPLAAASSPHNAIVGHAIGAAAGYLSLVVFGLTDAPPALVEGVAWNRVGGAALSLGLTAGLMVWLGAPHPPAGATTLIVSLGILHTPVNLAVLMLAVVVLVALGYVINHLAGIDYPRWKPRPAVADTTGGRSPTGRTR